MKKATKTSVLSQQEFLRLHKKKENKIIFFRILIFAAFFFIWEFSAYFGLLNDFIFSSPSRIVNAFIFLMSGGAIFGHMGITLLETLISFLIVLFLGLAVAIILWWNESISKIIEPYLIALNSLPKSALAPILIVWLGNNMKTIIVCAIMLAVFGTIINLYTEFANVDTDKILLIKTLGGRKKDVLFKVVLPANFPSIISSMKVNIGLCLVGVIIGEFLAANAGLGYLIIYGSQIFKLDYVMLSIIILCIMAALLYSVVNVIQKKYEKRYL